MAKDKKDRINKWYTHFKELLRTENYRGISPSCIAAKLSNKMTLNRIRSKIDKHLRSNPNGFWPGRSTTAHMLALRRLIDHEGVKSHNLKAFLVFTDFKKAFDSVHEGRVLQILRAYDIPEKQIGAIGLLYQGTKARTPDGETDFFEIQAGVLQGGTLAPYIFAIVLDYAMRRAIDGREEELGFKVDRRRSRRHHPVVDR